MNALHHSLGVMGALAMLVLIGHGVSQVVVNASDPFCELVERGKKVMDRVTPGDGVPLLDSKRLTGPRASVLKTGQSIYKYIEMFAESDANGFNDCICGGATY